MIQARALATIAVALLSILVAGCATLVDTDAMRLCRTIVPIIDHDGARIEVLESVETPPSTSGEVTVGIDYVTPVATAIVHRLTCTFATTGWTTPAAGIEALTAVSTVDGDIGPIRLWLLKKYWLESGEASAADPAPFATIWRVPEVPLATATTLQVLLSSLPVISVYALLAAAYALLYGLTGRINLAFGELTILGGYAAFLGFVLGSSGSAALPGLAIAALVGLATALVHGGAFGRLVLVPLVRAPGQQFLIATLGMAIAWSELVRLTQGNSNRWMPPLLNRPLALVTSGDMTVTLTPMAVVVAAIAILAAVGFVAMMYASRFGLHWRATSDDPKAAALCGIDPARVMAQTLVMTALLAGLAGLLTTLYYGGVGFAGGLATALKALVAAILGGIASPASALLGGLILGLAEALWSSAFPIEMRDPAIFVLLALTLALKPDGLFAAR